jgi:O-acetylhomoserine/O-acetylserine sulfhydrylase-like pyridoxal-dependent enzyme
VSYSKDAINEMKLLSPRRNSSDAGTVEELVSQQLEHFGIDPKTDYGQSLARIAGHMYESQHDVQNLWRFTVKSMSQQTHGERIQQFNAKKFLSFQLAKILDTLQNPFRASYQSLGYMKDTTSAKGAYPIFDNVTAIFSATPVIARTATYVYACAEWIEDAFRGDELMLEIYSRLLNPTSVCLANHVVDLECGPYAGDYMAWNFNSGMAAIDSALSHVLGRDDVLISSRNVYGGSHQLIHDWFAKPGNLAIAVETYDGHTAADFEKHLLEVQKKHADRLAEGRNIYVYLESPSNPQGYVLDVPGICKIAHQHGLKVMLDATVATPFLIKPLQRDDPEERPDFVIHSYTKDLSGCGSVIAGCVIGRNIEMFIPKGKTISGKSWDQTMFWNVYYVKGAFLNADAAFEVLQGMKTLSIRMLRKCINTVIFAKFLNSHPDITVNCNAIGSDPNSRLREEQMYLGLPAPLFTFDMGNIPRSVFQPFFDSLSPTFGHMISLGQSNTIVSCPALTTHSELDEQALLAAGLTKTTVRCAVGDEDPIDLIRHVVHTAKCTIDSKVAGFSSNFMSDSDIRALIRDEYVSAHSGHVERQLAECEIFNHN